ncbi:MAG: FAD-dependent oxidoreductase [Nocardioidaceae bacterium]|nr:FAD-dependent oxidoreductase [Nocardioidaceae bacterium]
MTTKLEKTPTYVDGEVSYWFRDIGLPGRRPALPGDTSVDVAIVGGGMTGLWTAYYLKASQPDLRIVVLEKEFAGFGASGRNGGWLSAEPPGQTGRYAKSHGVDSVVRLQQEMFASVDEVIRVVSTERIDAHVHKDGLLHVATTPSQQARLLKRMPALRRYGWTEDDLRMMSAPELAQRVNVAGAVGAAYSPHCARIQPAMLVRGLADVVEEMGVSIYEGTEVTDVKPSLAVTKRGRVRADFVIRALEGFTAGLEGFERTWLPMNSSMIVTEPLPESAWDEIGWQGAELVGDEAHGFAYCQRTSDGRIALGGRAVPYRYGSRWDNRGETMSTTFDQLRVQLARLFPATRSVGIEHAWAGVLGVPRDWCASVGLDRATGLGWAGGYVGHGVTSSNLAGRTLTDLVLQHETDLVTLPWVGRKVRKWEVEPARWLAVRSLYLAYHAADRRERASGSDKTSAIASIADLISGRR